MKSQWRITIEIAGPERDGNTMQLANMVPLFEINRLLRGSRWHGVGISVEEVKAVEST